MKHKIVWIIIGAVGVALVQLLSGWKPAHFVGPRPFSAAALACSADGKIVYAADLEAVYRSEDSGTTWTRVKSGTPIRTVNFE
jgi:hypothetical protein